MPGEPPQTGVLVTGRGEVSAVADTVAVAIGVSVKRPTAPAAIADAAAAATALVDALQTAGVADADIRTANFSINQEFTYPPEGGPLPDGYRVTNSVVATVRSVDTAGAVIDAATAAGGADVVVQGVTFGLADDTAATVAARDAAFADARSKAEQYAALSGRELGPVVSITETSGAPTGPPVRMLAAKAMGDVSTPIRPGDVETTVTVDVRWAFAD